MLQVSRPVCYAPGSFAYSCNGEKLYRSDQGILDRRSRIIMIFWSCGILCPGSISYNNAKISFYYLLRTLKGIL